VEGFKRRQRYCARQQYRTLPALAVADAKGLQLYGRPVQLQAQLQGIDFVAKSGCAQRVTQRIAFLLFLPFQIPGARAPF
jgi:hypothetical protein